MKLATPPPNDQPATAHGTNATEACTDADHRQLFELSPLPMWVFDLETHRFLAVNRAAVRQYGYSREEFLAMTVLDIRPAEDVPLMLEVLRTLAATPPAPRSWRHQRKDGSIVWVEVQHHPVTFAGRRAELVVINDVTERRRAEDALRQRNETLRALFQASPLAIYALDLSGRVLNWNAAAERMFGWSEAEALGRPVPFVAPEAALETRQLLERVANGESFHDMPLRRQRRDGTPIDISVFTAPMYDSAGRVTSVMAMAADVAERRRLEEQVRQAQKMEAIGRLAGGVAHDFNNLLTAIGVYCEILLRSLGPNEAQRDNVREIKKATDRATQLTRQLLAFGRKQVLQPRVLDLNAVVADVAGMLGRLIGEHVALTLDLAPDAGCVHTDPGQLEQVIINLALNARDAMPGGGALTIGTSWVELDAAFAAAHAGARPGPHAVLTVTDSGHGMEPEVIERMFEPFFTTRGKGVGLGLATVHGIVSQSGGAIAVESQVHRGTTFRVYLPRVPDAARPAAVRAPAPAAPPARGSETVLLVEDEDVVRNLAHRILLGQGYTVLEARNAGEALLLFERHRDQIALLLSDVVMPHMSGPELAARLRVVRPELKVLFVSGYADSAIGEHTPLGPGTALVHKPFTMDGLALKVRELLGGAPAPSARGA